jgi:hypothetical protein
VSAGASGDAGGAGGGAGGRREPFRLRDHVGMISGAVLGTVLFAFLVLLALAGSPGAFVLLVVIVVGVAMVALGGRLRAR